jgi:6-phosphofructokinase 1
MGKAAVEFAVAGDNAIMPTIDRISNNPFKWEVGKAPLSEVANVEKMMPMDFISEDGFGITDACKEYLIPLIQGEDYPPYKDGMPQYVTLKNEIIDKKLDPFEV